MQSGLVKGPVSNKKIIEFSPIEKIAKVIDFYFPFLVKNLLDIVDNQEIDILNKKYNLNIFEGSKHQHLVEYFWAIAKKENIYDLMFFQDYMLYINFFLQYPILAGKEMDENMNFSRILAEYCKMELTGNVAQITDKDFCYFVYQNDMSEEIANIDETIAQYKAESKLYQADRVSEEKGKVTVELMDGTIKEGISWGISGIYTGKGYEIKEMLTLADMDEKGYMHLEEEEIKNIL
ncbi:MAG: hypothetical protein J6A75_08390 [Lachnospiraceae bacterium]|nr:hypothetical protein [Lachnospiraceae bacterium]